MSGRGRISQLLSASAITLAASIGFAQEPWIQITDVPAYGSNEDVRGAVGNVDPSSHTVAVYIFVEGWWTKPYFNAPLTPIAPDSTWTCDITTGAADPYATLIAAFLLPAGISPPAASGQTQLPEIPEALASTQVRRGPPVRTLSFAGYEWTVKRRDFPAGPGNNYFSDRPEDVWVDMDGLHLTIKEREGVWYCTEVILGQSFGYGTYSFQTRGRVDDLDPRMVVGLFTWDDDPAYAHREMDIEFARWGVPDDPTNAQFVVQPCSACPGCGNRCIRFRVEPSDVNLTHYLVWRPGSVTFRTYSGEHIGNTPDEQLLIRQWTFVDSSVPPPGRENVRFNFWLYGGAPITGQGEEFLVTDFAYSPRIDAPETGAVIEFKSQPDVIRTNLRNYPVLGYCWRLDGVTTPEVRLNDEVVDLDTLDGFRKDVLLTTGSNTFRLDILTSGELTESYTKEIVLDPGYSTERVKLLYAKVRRDWAYEETIILNLDDGYALGFLPDVVITAVTHGGKYAVDTRGTVYRTSDHVSTSTLPFSRFPVYPVFSKEDAYCYAGYEKIRFGDDLAVPAPFPVAIDNRDATLIENDYLIATSFTASRAIEFVTVDLRTDTLVNTVWTTPTRVLHGDSAVDPSGKYAFLSTYSYASGALQIVDLSSRQVVFERDGYPDFMGQIEFLNRRAFVGAYGNSWHGGGGVYTVSLDLLETSPSVAAIDLFNLYGAGSIVTDPEERVYATSRYSLNSGRFQGRRDRRGIDVLRLKPDADLEFVKSYYLNSWHWYTTGHEFLIKPGPPKTAVMRWEEYW